MGNKMIYKGLRPEAFDQNDRKLMVKKPKINDQKSGIKAKAGYKKNK